ncbi:MAG: glycosyltransferase family protein [bacterium]|nr:glycosyltransferase family protein [bacterium]
MTTLIIQARMGSTRLPGKVLKKIGGKTLLEILIERVGRADSIDKIVIATTDKAEDKKIVDLAKKLGLDYFQGSENDVLDRYYQAAKKFKADIVIRITGDCPLMDSEVIDRVVGYYKQNSDKFDYVSNVHPPTFPDGMDVEVFPFITLENAWKNAKLPSEREHVTAYIANHPEIFRIGNIKYEYDASSVRSPVRLTVDRQEDFEVVKRVLENFSDKKDFGLEDIMDLARKDPEIFLYNGRHERNEGMKKSLEEDRRFLSDGQYGV